MKILHLVAGNRWTGAAAPAFAEVEALRAAGVEAHYAYVGGYKLEAKLGDCPFAHPLIDRNQNPVSLRRTVTRLIDFIERHRIDIVHAHLTWDHWLARFAARGRGVAVARTFHSARTLRGDPLTGYLVRRTAAFFVINETFRDAAALRGRRAVFTPPPLDQRHFTPQGPNVREVYGIRPDETLVTVIGKLSKNRGFEEALQTFAVLRTLVPCRLMIIGHGEHRPILDRFASNLGIGQHVIWAGYHESDLADHYRAANALLFTVTGSDEGHRAVIEAMACGIPPVTYPIAGMPALLGDLTGHLTVPAADPGLLARRCEAVLSGDRDALRSRLLQIADSFGYAAAATRLTEAYQSATAST